MSTDNPDFTIDAASCPRPAGLSGFGLADWLCLAAAPTFATMALLTAAFGGQDMMCMAGPGVSKLSGMVPMYLLMAAFHLAPWLRLVAGRTGLDVVAEENGRHRH
jgi:hypothetical protein